MSTILRVLLALLFTSVHATALYDPPAVYLTWQRSPESTMTIQWITPQDRTSDLVEYRPNTSSQEWLSATGTHTPAPEGYPYFIHRAELTNLLTETIYDFRLGSDGVLFKFRTMPAALKHPLRFVVGGDAYHDTLPDLQKMNLQAAKTDPAFALLGGDLAYTSSNYAFLFNLGFVKEKITRWMEFLIAWKKQMVRSDGCLIPIIPAIGNHEVMGRFGQTPSQAPFFYALFPTPNLQAYRVLDFGSYLTLVFLDSGHTHPIEGKQTDWLFQTLEQRQHFPNKFALYHVGAYPSVRPFNGTVHQQIRNSWVPIFERFGLHTAFENHDHAYKRTHPLRNGKIDPTGVLYMGDGAWGIAVPRIPATPAKRRYLAKTASLQHVLLVTLNEKERHYRAIDVSGNTIDEYTQQHQQQ